MITNIPPIKNNEEAPPPPNPCNKILLYMMLKAPQPPEGELKCALKLPLWGVGSFYFFEVNTSTLKETVLSAGFVLAYAVTVLFNFPSFPLLLNFTVINPLSPGATGSLE